MRRRRSGHGHGCNGRTLYVRRKMTFWCLLRSVGLRWPGMMQPIKYVREGERIKMEGPVGLL
jgi:hypothetical protein